MARRTRMFFALILLAFLAACGPLSQHGDIKAVQDATWTLLGDSVQLGPAVNALAGVAGKVSWESFKPDQYKDNPDVVVVQADVEKKDEKGKPKTATFQFLFNRQTRFVDLGYYAEDGKPKSKLEAMLALKLSVL